MKDCDLWVRRRAALGAALAASTGRCGPSTATTSALALPLAPRLKMSSLTPMMGLVDSQAGPLRYPPWLLGTWQVRNTISRFSMPLGPAFIDPFVLATAKEDVAAAETLSYLMRFVEAATTLDDSAALPAVQDRSFNAREETNAFLGADGGRVTGCRYSTDARSPHGRLLLNVVEPSGDGRGGLDPTATTIDLNIEWAQWDAAASEGAFVTSEILRQRVTRPAVGPWDPAQDQTEVLEVITRFLPPSPTVPAMPSAPAKQPGLVRVRNRIAQYPLVFSGSSASERQLSALAGGRAISIFDYDWTMERVGGTATREGGWSDLASPRRV